MRSQAIEVRNKEVARAVRNFAQLYSIDESIVIDELLSLVVCGFVFGTALFYSELGCACKSRRDYFERSKTVS